MIDFLFVFVAVVLLGFIVGVGVLIHQETEWYRNFMHNRPILGWISTFLVGAFTWYVAAYILLRTAVFVLSLLLGQHNGSSVQ